MSGVFCFKDKKGNPESIIKGKKEIPRGITCKWNGSLEEIEKQGIGIWG